MLKEELAATRGDWRERRGVLDDRIRMLQAQKQRLLADEEQVRSDVATAEQKLAEVRQRKAAAEASLEELSAPLDTVETEIRSLIAQLPPFLAGAMDIPEPLRTPQTDRRGTQTTPPSSEAMEASGPQGGDLQKPGERTPPPRDARDRVRRFRDALSATAAVQQLNRQIHAGRMAVPADGEPVEMDVLFLGLSQAFGVTPDGSRAAVRRWRDGQWRWTAAPDHARAIRQALAIYRKDKPARFIALPLQRPADLQAIEVQGGAP